MQDPVIKDDDELFDAMKKIVTSDLKMGLIIWMKRIEKESIILTKALFRLSDEYYLPFTKIIPPFNKLPMKKEYVLHVLYKAFLDTDDKYKEIRKSKIYTDIFKYRIKILRLIEIPDNKLCKSILESYCQSNII